MILRRETEHDFSEIYDFVKLAFETAKVSDGKEQDFVNRLRASGNYIPELALVAEEDGQIIGHIMLTKTQIDSGDAKHQALLLAPLAVALEHRNRGVGATLINESLGLARTMGYRAVFLVGDPAYYQRFGFRSTEDFGIKDTHGIPPQYVMAHELVDNALDGISGTVCLE